VLLGDVDSPIHGLPEPDMFYACNSQCNVVERWGDEVQGIYKDRNQYVPHYVLRTSRLTKREEHTADEKADFRKQLDNHIIDICDRFGTTYCEDRLREIVTESDKSNKLWQQCLELAQRTPAPWSSTDAFTAMAPIVIARGLPSCTKYYECLYHELLERVNHNVQAVDNESIRLLWDAIPIWPRKNWFSEFAAERQAIFVASTYTHSWWFSFEPDDAMNSLVNRYIWNTMNRSTEWILNWTKDLVTDYKADGIVCHWNASCGIWNSYVKRRLPGYKAAGIPYIVIEADMVDARHFNEDIVSGQLSEFIDQLKSNK